MRVGIFDSGIGGVSVLKSLLEARLFEEIIYYGDTARVPYGTKDKETIITYSLEALDFFSPFKIDLLIIACNTVSAYALDILREKAPYPVVGVIEAGVLAVQNKLSDKEASILVLATQATTQSQVYPKALSALGYQHIESIATTLFVPLVEEGIYEGEILQSTFKHYFHSITTPPKAIILGCTHYPFISKAISGYFQEKSLLIHSGEAIVEQLKKSFELPLLKNPPKISFYSSQNSQSLATQAEKLLLL